jgi:2',3'-cyclic-nucleotide 2'-phosphodiesterase (5'-nucleotidase family)
VDPNRTYIWVSNDFMAKGGDGYTVFLKSGETLNSSLLLSWVVTEAVKYVADQGIPIAPYTDGRIRITGK